MSAADLGTVLSGAAAVVAIIISAATAISVYFQSKETNDLTQTANNTATQALGQAQEANRIAVDANQLADNANTIAGRALRKAQDDVQYNWTLQIDDDGIALVANDSGHAALDVTVTIDKARQLVAEVGPTDVEAFSELRLDVRSAIEEHFAEVLREGPQPMVNTGYVVMAGRNGYPVHSTFRAWLRWTTSEQVPRTAVIEEIVSHQMVLGGGRRRLNAGDR